MSHYKLKSADIDIDPAELSIYWGGNGDIYVTIYDRTGIHGVRVCYSGGPDNEIGIRSAMAKVAQEFLKMENNGS